MMTLTMSFKAALRVRRYDHKFSNPKFKPRFRPTRRRFAKPNFKNHPHIRAAMLRSCCPWAFV